MSNIAGKAYAMNVVTPIPKGRAWVNKVIFQLGKSRWMCNRLNGLLTLSMIHYARWVIVRPGQFPRLSEEQPPERLENAYMLFFSNFNGSWEQYVDSFSSAIPDGLDLFWRGNVNYPKSVPLRPFYEYITGNQVETNFYYNAYPMASANDVKAGSRVRKALLEFMQKTSSAPTSVFQAEYRRLMRGLQHDLYPMERAPIVSLARVGVERNREERSLEGSLV